MDITQVWPENVTNKCYMNLFARKETGIIYSVALNYSYSSQYLQTGLFFSFIFSPIVKNVE